MLEIPLEIIMNIRKDAVQLVINEHKNKHKQKFKYVLVLINIVNMEIIDKKTDYLEFIFDIQVNDLKNYKNLIAELKLKEYKFTIIRHRKKDALLRRIIKNFKGN